MSQNRSKPLADRLIDRLKDNSLIAIIVVVSVIIIGIGSLTDSIDKTLNFFTKQLRSSSSTPPHPDSLGSYEGDPTVAGGNDTAQHSLSASINCSPVDIPLLRQQGGSLYAIYLDPKWGNQLVFTRSASWPQGGTPNDMAFQCEVVNNDNSALYGLAVVFTASFSGGSALPPKREIEITSPVSVDPQRSVTFYIADDTKHAQEVIPPESVSARVGDEKERRKIPVRYSTIDGRPVKLRGFNP